MLRSVDAPQSTIECRCPGWRHLLHNGKTSGKLCATPDRALFTAPARSQRQML